jgi:hypothetical protein
VRLLLIKGGSKTKETCGDQGAAAWRPKSCSRTVGYACPSTVLGIDPHKEQELCMHDFWKKKKLIGFLEKLSVLQNPTVTVFFSEF